MIDDAPEHRTGMSRSPVPEDPQHTPTLEIRRGGIPRYLGWMVDKVVRYDSHWPPLNVVVNGEVEGTLGPRGPRHVRAQIQPGPTLIEMSSIYSGLVYETLRIDVGDHDQVRLRYTPSSTGDFRREVIRPARLERV